jgi:hypothetical protein
MDRVKKRLAGSPRKVKTRTLATSPARARRILYSKSSAVNIRSVGRMPDARKGFEHLEVVGKLRAQQGCTGHRFYRPLPCGPWEHIPPRSRPVWIAKSSLARSAPVWLRYDFTKHLSNSSVPRCDSGSFRSIGYSASVSCGGSLRELM